MPTTDAVKERAQRAAIEIGERLLAQGWTLATAESCTGGLIGHLLTNVAGSSRYFEGGIMAYAYSAKRNLLGVSQADLDNHGAVSRQVVMQMARGARQALGTDVGVAVTGIAGPGGGTPTKPVGTVYVGLSTPRTETYGHYVWDADREGNKWRSASAALELALGELCDT